MFTGIVETIGQVRSVRSSGGGIVIAVDLGRIADGVGIGDSVAVNGICLTVGRLSGAAAEFDVSDETAKRSTAGELKTSSEANIERAMAANGRFGGHIVQGHIDGTAKIKAIEKKGEFCEIAFSADQGLTDDMVLKGSVCVNGVSLTVSRLEAGSFSVSVIPTTMKETTLSKAKAGDAVNIETDIIIKAVKKQLEKILPSKEGLTVDKLRELGF